jgi:hypothetical protein
MEFSDRLRSRAIELRRLPDDVFAGVVYEAKRSIVEGSEITAAPGQPVDVSNLKTSWHDERPSRDTARIITNCEYALPVEEGIGPHGPVVYGAAGHGRSTVGGSHSVKLTIAGMSRIVAFVVAKVLKR